MKSTLLLICATICEGISFRNGVTSRGINVDDIYITSTSPTPYLLQPQKLFQPSADYSHVYITSTSPPPVFQGSFKGPIYQQEAQPSVVRAPPELWHRYPTKIGVLPPPEDHVDALQNNPAGFRPLHYSPSHLAESNDGLYRPEPGRTSNSNAIQHITNPNRPSKKKQNFKKAHKKPKYPKKYKASTLKKLSKSKLKPVEELQEFEGPQSIKPKRKIPLNFYNQAPIASNHYSEDVDAFPKSSNVEDLGRFETPASSSSGDRIEFQMFGMDGPESYKFGYDTGSGHNRHFRFEERDGSGKVRGHYGFYDEDGTMRMMKYEADPHTGFHVGPYDHPENNFS